jgi:hypothetical protein
MASPRRGHHCIKLGLLGRNSLASLPVCRILFSQNSHRTPKRFNPIFVLPVAESGPSPAPTLTSEAISHTPGRRTGTGSANITATSRAVTARAPILGFRQVSLVSALRLTGSTPATPTSGPYQSLEDIRKLAGRPIAVFPECTTSNGRALLRFADVFQQKVPVRGYNVFVMCVRSVSSHFIFRPSSDMIQI